MEVIRHLQEECDGNPHLILSYFHSLLIRGFIEVIGDEVMMTERLRQTLEHNHFFDHYPLPYQIQNQLNVFFDQKLTNINE